MKLNIIKYFTIASSLTVLVISLTKNAVTIDYQGVKHVPSLNYFLMGGTAFLGGGLFEEIIWLANPLCLVAIFLLIYNNKSAKLFSIIALVLAASFSTWKELLGAESGAMAEIIAFESGYFLWVLSIVILTTGTFLYFKIGGAELANQNKFQFKKPRIF
ncbi:MAG TPA: hypothetical protein PKN96_06840 [Flavobacterium sp.]|uniref:hypothetical protein n=1 Tax=Flavobacterium sp. TaxID=239 RepID=UPI002CD6DF7A|nr:hypothetical protein [Flavobacterium sp.]HNP32992.1 hypothetical protein [Flavobacterium sp.]